MRMYSMYVVCKAYLEKVKGMKAQSRSVGNSTVYFIDGWQKNRAILDEIAKMAPLRDKVKKIIQSVPVAFQDTDKFDISNSIKSSYDGSLNTLITSMQTIVDAYEVMGVKNTDEELSGFDVKLPKFNDLGEFAKCLNDLDFIIKQCPYLQNDDSEIKFDSVDIGSTWLTFMIVGASATMILSNLSKLVDMAVKIKSHVVTVRMQEEALRSMELRNEIAAELTDAFKKANKTIVDQCIGDMKNELGELKDGEEEGKAEKSIEKLAHWMDKGLQIYSSIDAPQEIKDLFPQQEDVSLLTDDLQKLIETKNEEA